MVDDVNFCGGQLRLAAFLRVVEYDMPQRPSRLKRRIMPLVDQFPVNAAACEPNGAANATEASAATQIPQVSRAKVSGRSRAPLRTRKRRLPVNGLALLRTTTTDGLPEPGVRSVMIVSWFWHADEMTRTPIEYSLFQSRKQIPSTIASQAYLLHSARPRRHSPAMVSLPKAAACTQTSKQAIYFPRRVFCQFQQSPDYSLSDASILWPTAS
jgi:hypothetical protein